MNERSFILSPLCWAAFSFVRPIRDSNDRHLRPFIARLSPLSDR